MNFDIASIPLTYETDVVLARQRARLIASCLGFERQDQNFIATAVSEIARNALEHAGGGQADFVLEDDGNVQRLTVRISDSGPGIADTESILSGRFRSECGLGVGLRGARRLMDEFEIESAPGRTVVSLSKKIPPGVERHDSVSLRRLANEIAKHGVASPLQELRRQNQDLLMAMTELRRRQEELAEMNKELEDTNRGVVALYAELDDRAERLKHADQLKSRFLSHMSHEFRTPLSSILALSRMLLDGVDGTLTSEQTTQVQFILSSAATLKTLVDDLLDLAKVEAGKVDVSATEFTVGQLFGALRGALRPLVRDDVALHIEAPPDLPPLATDEGKLSQILRNLISNSIKFTEAGEIKVTAACPTDDWIIFSVTDTGVGIAPEDHEAIFDEFSQVKNPLQKRAKGSGLGLPISRRLAQLLGGDIDVKSEPGRGATFTLSIPCRYAPSGARQVRPFRILIVDDDEAFRYIVRQFLAGASYSISEAADGLEALRRVREEVPDVILLDISMPTMDGFEFLEHFSSLDPAVKSSVVIMTSAVLDAAERHRLARASSILRKDSLSKSTLIAAIARATAAPGGG